ncbi:hypothetical protein LVJ94_03215 [Pendulispora rubella]|uniref:Uncharacterized protein n=1 Tax=Pendulispora rubella TaxID=2741070 RepID=A0ABZ2L8W5_9BACT
MKTRKTVLIAGIAVLQVAGCRESPTRSEASIAVAPIDASLDDASSDAAQANPNVDKPEEDFDRTMMKSPWIVLHAQMMGETSIFDVENDGSIFFSRTGSGNPPIRWRGKAEASTIRKLEETLRKSRFCSLAKSESTALSKGGGMSISVHEFDCFVALSYPTWRTNPRARAGYSEVRKLMNATCADKCRNLPMLSDE